MFTVTKKPGQTDEEFKKDIEDIQKQMNEDLERDFPEDYANGDRIKLNIKALKE